MPKSDNSFTEKTEKNASQNLQGDINASVENSEQIHQLKTEELNLQDKAVVFPVVHEFPTISKEVVETGQVKISKRVTEIDETVDVPLFQDEVAVERVPVNQFVEKAPQITQNGNTMIIPVVEERLIVEKRLFVVEELHVVRRVLETHSPQQIKLRKEEVNVTRIPAVENLDSPPEQ